MAEKKRKKIMVAALNWGLGHAARCIPIIKNLEKNGAEVLIASDGIALNLLRKEFPKMKVFELPAYDIDYKGKNFTWTMLRQTGKILSAIAKEHHMISEISKEEHFDAIISDNRFGCHVDGLWNIFMTHQLNLATPSTFMEKPATLVNHALIKPFDEIWVPDFVGFDNLAGKLSHGHGLANVAYLGALSRMERYEVNKKYDIAVVLSGPEPKRSEFELEVFRQCLDLTNKQIIVVRGMPERWEYYFMKPHLEVVSFMTSKMLNDTMLASDMIIARSGYSTIMDLFYLGKPALLVPTPGQTEQEYLATELAKKKVFLTQKQENLNIKKGIEEIGGYRGFSESMSSKHSLDLLVKELIQRLG